LLLFLFYFFIYFFRQSFLST